MGNFKCNHCGDTFKKRRVKNHYQSKCKNRVAVSCMDCNEDFDALAYNNHTKCISKEVKCISKKVAVGLQPKPSTNRRILNRKKMVNQLQMLMARKDLTPEQTHLGNTISLPYYMPNTKRKFQLYIKNAMPGTRMEVVDQFWELLQEELKTIIKAQSGMSCKVGNGNALSKRQRKQLKKKSKLNEAELQEVENDPSVKIIEGEGEVKQKKSKKSGGSENKLEDSNVEEGQLKKKGKKRKGEEIGQSVCEAKIIREHGNTEALPVNGSSIVKSTKFNRRDTVVKLLESKSDKGLSLKRRQKKGMAEC